MHYTYPHKCPSLKAHLTVCQSSVSFGLDAGTQRVLLVVGLPELDTALSYISQQAPHATLAGIVIFPQCINPESAAALADSIHRPPAPIIPLSAIAESPEADILVYFMQREKEFQQPLFGSLLFHVLQHRKDIFMYPERRSDASCTRQDADFFSKHAAALEWVYSNLYDQESKASFAGTIKAMITGNIGYIQLAPFRHYRHPATWPQPGDIVIDGGIASRLYEVAHFADAVGPFGKVYGFEPNQENFVMAAAELTKSPWSDVVELIPQGLFSKQQSMPLFLKQGSSCLREFSTADTAPCQVTDLDSFVEERDLSRVDVLKLDIEGAEVSCLCGATRTLRRWKPRLMISGYHNSNKDLVAVPEKILQIEPSYKLGFATSYPFMAEMVFYAW